ncbi:DNA polymerase III subunit beta [Sphingosinicella sp. BN140058]|uniref:DNA polymerase III subunit beta n=1 Tax=Sphingosinicella sp. BN140058 TaxID=1892855 RepID=UPI001012428E|nr:DNA polymerase III subunit beta [Sphingosinicella sp. BN140058]QAY80124.1 DNA polymerase III subunit beta [Sphingosinicella sp. BN140058]
MKLLIERAALLRVLSHSQSVVERRNTIPVLSNVMIEARNDAVTLTATDLDLQITETVGARVELGGRITVSAHTLFDIIRKMPDGCEIELAAGDAQLTITGGRARFRLAILPAEDFPVIATGELPTRFELDAEELGTLLGRVRYAISTEETRYYLNGIYLHTTDEKELLAVATDGHRLARNGIPAPAGIEIDPGIIIPRKCVAELLKLVDEVDGDVSIELSQTKIRFLLGNAILTSKVIDGTFPQYQRVIPTTNDKIVTVDATSLAQGIDRVATIATEKTRAVRVDLSSNKLTLIVESPENGRAVEEVEADYTGADLSIGFNARYFLEVLNHHKATSIEISLADPAAPALLRPKTEGATEIGILMPMRV